MYVIDFETASKRDVRIAGPWAYARDPSTIPLMLSYAPEAGGPVKVWFPGAPFPEEVAKADGYIAHNAEFEMAVWNECLPAFVPGLKPLTPERTHCTMAQARYWGLPGSLDGAGRALKLKHLKSESGQRLISIFCSIAPDGSRTLAQDYPDKWQEFISYCTADTEAERELWNTLPKIPPDERQVWIVHTRINMRGLLCDMLHAGQLNALCNSAEALLLEGDDGWLLSRPVSLKSWLSILGVEVDDCSQDTLENALLDASPTARGVIIKRLDFAKSANKKYKRMLLADGGDKRLRGLHVFYGAHTGRFSGALIQPQNIVRSCVKDIDYNLGLLDYLAGLPVADAIAFLGGPGDALAWASAMIRPMLMATHGKLLVGSDFKAIEARVLAWLVGATRMLRIYREGGDPYRDMAAFIFHVPYDDVTSYQRWVGKQVILGCGYGMGWLKFMLRCALEGQEIPEQLCREAVKGYRENVAEVPAGWNAIDEAVRWAMDPAHWDRGKYVFGEKLIVWATTKGQSVVSLGIRLPDGSHMRYKFPRFVTIPSRDPERGDEQIFTYLSSQKQSTDPGPASLILKRCEDIKKNYDMTIDPQPYLRDIGQTELAGFRRVGAWGGKFMENIVQKMARNLLTGAMVRVDPVFPVVLHVHDELVPEVGSPADEQEVARLMSIVPEPYAGCPIEVETWCGERYRK